MTDDTNKMQEDIAAQNQMAAASTLENPTPTAGAEPATDASAGITHVAAQPESAADAASDDKFLQTV